MTEARGIGVRTLLTNRKERDTILAILSRRGMGKAVGAGFSPIDKEGIIEYYFPQSLTLPVDRGEIV